MKVMIMVFLFLLLVSTNKVVSLTSGQSLTFFCLLSSDDIFHCGFYLFNLFQHLCVIYYPYCWVFFFHLLNWIISFICSFEHHETTHCFTSWTFEFLSWHSAAQASWFGELVRGIIVFSLHIARVFQLQLCTCWHTCLFWLELGVLLSSFLLSTQSQLLLSKATSNHHHQSPE